MKKLTGIIAISLALLGWAATTSYGQTFVPTPVEVSSEKVNVNGEMFYTHKVLKGQTLYSIAKAYGTTTDTLIANNPSVKDGLKSDIVIYIPAKGEQQSIAIETPDAPAPKSVKPEGAKPKKTVDVSNINKSRMKKHTVKWYENIYDIASKYKVPVESIIVLNELGENVVLKKRQVLYIPNREFLNYWTESLRENKDDDIVPFAKKDVASAEDSVKSAEVVMDNSLYRYFGQRSYKIALVLPFNTKDGADKANTNQMDFYAGALLAFNEFQQMNPGKNYKLEVIDINDYGSPFALTMSGKLDDCELIIGPVYEKNLTPLATWAQGNRIPVVSPLDPKAAKLVKANPYFFQYPPTPETLKESVYNKIAEDAKDCRSLLLYEKWTGKSEFVTRTMSSLNSRGVVYDTLSYDILEGRGIDATMAEKMDMKGANKVIVASEKEAFVADVLRNLLLVKGNSDSLTIDVYGPSKWKNFEIIELEYFHLLHTHLSIQYYVDYNTLQVNNFISSFRENFNTDPTPYAFQGHDILMFFIEALDEYGREFPIHINNKEKSLLQSTIRFEKASSEGGFQNNGVRNIIYYDNWEIKSWR